MRTLQSTLSFFLLFTTVIALSGLTQSCQKAEDSADVNQDRIHQYLELFYDEAQDKTYAYAQFRFGNAIGTPLQLATNATVSVEGNTMSWNDNFNLNRYEWEWTGKRNSATFTYTDNDGNTFVNTVIINDIGFPASLDTISKDSSYNLVWTGDPLAADEAVWVSINEDNEANAATFNQNDQGSTSITLTKDGLSKIDPSSVTLWIDRNNKPAITQATSVGGILVGKYRDTATDVILIE